MTFASSALWFARSARATRALRSACSALWAWAVVSAVAGCATDRRRVETTRPFFEVADTSDFSPIRQMADNGRATPAVSRRCEPGMAPRFDPASEAYVVSTWRATSELMSFLVTVVPTLLDVAEQRPDQMQERDRHLLASELPIDAAELGGILQLRRRPSRPAGVLVRETLFTDDLWMRDVHTRSVVYFDGRIDYGAADSPLLPAATARVAGWAEVHRLEAEPPRYLVGADVKLRLETEADGRVAVDGILDAACGGRMQLQAKLRYDGPCSKSPASVVDVVRFEQRGRTLELRGAGATCDACLDVSLDGAEPTRLCPRAWAPPDGPPQSSTLTTTSRG